MIPGRAEAAPSFPAGPAGDPPAALTAAPECAREPPAGAHARRYPAGTGGRPAGRAGAACAGPGREILMAERHRAPTSRAALGLGSQKNQGLRRAAAPRGPGLGRCFRGAAAQVPTEGNGVGWFFTRWTTQRTVAVQAIHITIGPNRPMVQQPTTFQNG